MHLTRVRNTLRPALVVVAFALAIHALPAPANHYILCSENSKCDPPLPPAPPPLPEVSFGDAGPKAVGATRYVATRIPPQAADRSTTADAISASGAIAGAITQRGGDYFFDDETDVAAFVFSTDNVLTPIQAPGRSSHAYGINRQGDVVGYYQINGQTRAFRFSQGVVTDLLPGARDSAALAINEAGDIVGTSDGRAFVLGADGRLEVLANESYGYAINDLGQAAGFAFTSEVGNRHLYHAVRFGGGSTEDLGALGDYAYGFGINASGDVVGESFSNNAAPIPFVYRDGRMQKFGEMDGSASAINAAGTVVGSRYNARGSTFIYLNGQVYDLADLVEGLDGARLVTASAINDAGQIAARACTSGKRYECFGVRLDPVPLPSVRAVEFYHAGMDHYVMTADASEIAKLDDGTLSGWTRTGEEFGVKPGPQAGTAPVCRMFTNWFPPKSSHFYTPSAAECAIVKRNPRWEFEGIVFYVATPGVDGTCPSGKVPVYRLYNNGQGGAPNHRYTTSTTIRERMLRLGWIPEGSGPLGVAMCAESD